MQRRHVRAVTLAAFALASLLVHTQTARAEGILRGRGSDGVERGRFPLTRTEVRAEVAGQVTGVAVTQRFHNEFSERIEAVYVFPLPESAAVDDMEMHIGTRVVRALVRRRDEARAAYNNALSHGQSAALLEQERPNIFTFSVANIEPGQDVEVRLHYFHLARYDHGTYEIVFPMVVGPRYVPGEPIAGPQSGTGAHADTDRVADASRISPSYAPPGTRTGHAVSLAVHLDAGSEIQTLEAPAHEVVVERRGSAIAEVSLRDKDEIPNRDFILRWQLAAPQMRTAVIAHRPDAQTDGYLSLLLEPRHDAPATEIAPREIFFLLDTSGSMQGAPLDTARAAIRRALAALNPDDTFQIIDFADTASSFAPRPLANQPENIQRANAYLTSLRSSGGTNQLDGIHAALTAPGDSRRLRYVVFMTDGYIGNESEVIALTQREIGNARIFALGIGSSVNRFLLDEVSLAGRGVAEYLRPEEDATALVERFYQRIGRPYLTDIQVDFAGFGVQEVYPRRLPDLSAFQPLVLSGRYRASGAGVITVRGRIGMQPFERRVTVNLPAIETGNGAIARIWAREKISQLSREAYRGGDPSELVESITSVALSHHLVSRFTSLVAVDESGPVVNQAGAPARVNQAVDAPAGVNIQSAGGRSATGTSRSSSVGATRGTSGHLMSGDAIGDAYGYGGLGVSGTGWGGGGTGEGTIGLGSIGTTGHGYGSGGGRGLRGRSTAGPLVRVSAPTVTGLLSPEAIRRVVLRNLAQVTHCYEQALATQPTVSGRLTVQFIVGAVGQVIASSTSGPDGIPPALSACVAAAVRRWVFPSPAGHGVVTVSYPFAFTSPEGPTPAVVPANPGTAHPSSAPARR